VSAVVLCVGLVVASASVAKLRSVPAAPQDAPTDGADQTRAPVAAFDRIINRHARQSIEDGRHTFRFDTFGSEEFWGDALRLHEAVATLSPAAALAAGLKVDASALPLEVVDALRRGEINLNDPANTLLLLRQNAVVGVTGFFDNDTRRSIGIQCAFCHSTVDNTEARGVGSGSTDGRIAI
jgi:hypothetical protein